MHDLRANSPEVLLKKGRGMILITLFVLLLLLVTGSVLVDIPTMFFMLLVYLTGLGFTNLFNRTYKKHVLLLYSWLFIAGGIYMVLSYQYMISHDYKYLLAFDIYNSFHPEVEKYLSEGNYFSALKEIWTDYSFFSRYQYGYFTYATSFAFLGNFLGTNFYLTQNLSVLFLYPFTGVLLYRMMLVNNIDARNAYKYSLLIPLVSILFFYSFQTLRDTHILLLYLGAIYITLKGKFSVRGLICIILICIICCTFRIESGLFLFVLVPVYLLVSLKLSRQKFIVVLLSAILFVVALVLLSQNTSMVYDVFDANAEHYIDDITEGSGVISALQKIPIIGSLLSIVYNALQPIPFWSRLWVSSDAMTFGGEVYNIMNFPKSIAAFFHCMVIVYIFGWMLFKSVRRKCRNSLSLPMKYQLWVGLVFLYLQSAVISQRRLMAYYCIFYILFVIIRINILPNDNKKLIATSLFVFVVLQVIGVLYL